jgi:hypothetical protein
VPWTPEDDEALIRYWQSGAYTTSEITDEFFPNRTLTSVKQRVATLKKRGMITQRNTLFREAKKDVRKKMEAHNTPQPAPTPQAKKEKPLRERVSVERVGIIGDYMSAFEVVLANGGDYERLVATMPPFPFSNGSLTDKAKNTITNAMVDENARRMAGAVQKIARTALTLLNAQAPLAANLVNLAKEVNALVEELKDKDNRDALDKWAVVYTALNQYQ